jgi:3-hydroxybutyryl-CoA dehydrogenase
VAGEEKEKCLQNIELTNDIRAMVADIVIEAIVEKLEVKVRLFEELEKLNASYTILATNTSSIPITQMAARLKHPGRLIGMHFFNPAYIMKLVEVISGLATSNEVVELIKEFAVQLGKVPVVANDSPGFIVNRVARHYYVESLKILEENIADMGSIDRLMESSGFKMGPFRLMDLIGIDTNFSVTNSMYNAFHQDPKFRPSRLQQQKVDAGHYGKKSGKGFYEY